MARLAVNPGDVGVEVPDQGGQGGGGGGYGDQRDAIAQAMLAQMGGGGGQMMGGGFGGGMPQGYGGGGGGNPADDPNSAARQQQKLEDPDSYNSWFNQWQALHSQPQGMDYSQYFGRTGQPSGNITDVGWMNALMPWQGGVGIGGFPNAEPSGGTPYLGGGSMAWANPNFFGPGGGGYNPANDPNSAARQQQKLEDPASYALWFNALPQNQGGGLSGSAGYGGMSGGGGGGGGGAIGFSGGGGGGGPVGGGGAPGAPPGAPPGNPSYGNFSGVPGPSPAGVIGPTTDAFTSNPNAFGQNNPSPGFTTPGLASGAYGLGAFGGLGDDLGSTYGGYGNAPY